MPSLFILLVIFLVVVCMVLAISKFNQHLFIVFTVIAIAMGLVYGIPTGEVINTVKSDFRDTLASIGIVILVGAIIGTIPEETGTALTMANIILKMVGKRNSVLTMAIVDYMTGISVFCDSDFVILSPISRALISQSNISLTAIATTLSGDLCTTYCLVPPTPGPITMAGTLGADLRLTMLVGLLVSIPATLSALIYAREVSSKVDILANPEHTMDELLQKYGKLSDALHSSSPILLPIVLIALKSIGDFPNVPFGDGVIKTLFSFIGSPVTTLILGVFLAMIPVPAAEKKNTLSWVTESVASPAGILAITDAGGAFGAILQKLPIIDALSISFLGPGIGVFLPFIIAVLLKTTMDAPIVAIIAISAMIAPLMSALGFTSPLAKILVIMAIDVGPMAMSHANNSYFWMVSQFSDMKTKDAYKCRTGIIGAMGIVTIIVVFLLLLAFVH